MFQIISNIYNRGVITSVSLNEFINLMKNPDFVKKSQVDLARDIYKSSPLQKDDPSYKSIKNSLPCITFLNTFDGVINNENIVSPTGFMYLDIDRVDSIDLSSYSFVVSYWKSLSYNGYGILIKCSNTSELSENLKEMSSVLGIELDKGAVSKDRLNVIGYDYNIYFNPNYTNYDFKDNKKVSFAYNTNSSYRLQASDTKYENDMKLRFSNLTDILSEYDFNNEEYIVLKEKIVYAEVFVPRNIFEGNRNKSMFIICSQVRGLNTWLTREGLYRVCSAINKDKFKPTLDDKELNTIVNKVFEKENPVVMLNKTKRLLFNPNIFKTGKERQEISRKQVGKFRSDLTTGVILECVDNWNMKEDGKITLKKVALKTGFGISTIKKRSTDIKIYSEKFV